MRLSATERIIREAEEQDAGVASARNRDPRQVTGPSNAAARVPSTHDDAPAGFEVDIDGFESDDIDDEDECATLVDAERAAAALRELRSYPHPPQRPLSGASMPASVSSPSNRGPAVLAPAPPLPGAVSPASASSRTIPGWAGAVHLNPAAPRISPPQTPVVTEGPSESTELPVPTAPLDAAQPRHAVGRRLGFLIATATAAAVALGFGTWTSRSQHVAINDVTRESVIRPNRAPRTPVTPLIVPTAPNLPTPEAASAAPQLSPPPPPAPAPSDPASGANLGSPASGSSTSAAPRRQNSSMHKKSRSKRKVAKSSSRQRRAARASAHATKISAPHSAPSRPVEVASPPTVRAHDAPRRPADPDATLPISE